MSRKNARTNKIIRGITIKAGKELVVFYRKSDTVLSAYSLLKLKKIFETYGLNTIYCVLVPRVTHECCLLKRK